MKLIELKPPIFRIGHNPFVEHKCDVSDCAIFTQSTSMLPFEEYDAVIIHMLFLKLFQLPDFERRREHQRFIFLTQETPVMMPLYISSLENYFNWTMTYKRNSDIQFLYMVSFPNSSFILYIFTDGTYFNIFLFV